MERQLIQYNKEKKFSILEFLGLSKYVKKNDELLKSAGYKKIDSENIILLFIIIDLLVFFMLSVLNIGYMSYIIPIILLIIVPYIIQSIANRRHLKFNIQFSEAVQDIADYLKITGSLINALNAILPDLENPLKDSIQNIIKLYNTGASIEDALKAFARESKSLIVDEWVDSIIFAGQMKANVADICESTAKKIKNRIRQGDKIRSNLKGTKMTVTFIAAIMAAIMFLILKGNSMFSSAFQSTTGRIVIVYTIMSYLVTTLIIYRSLDKQIKI